MSAIEPIYPALGRRLQDARKRHKPRLSQDEVADKVGLPRSAISAIEGGRQRLLTHTLIRLCQVLELSPCELLNDLDNRQLEFKDSQIEGDISKSEMERIKALIGKAKLKKGTDK